MRPLPRVRRPGRTIDTRIRALLLALLLLAWSHAATAGALLHVEGDESARVAGEVRSALGPSVRPTTSRKLDAALNEHLGSETLASALSTQAGAYDLAALVKDVSTSAGANLAIVIAVTAHGEGLHVDVLLVPAEGGPPLLQAEDMPPLARRSERVAWWKKTFTAPEHPPTRIDAPAATPVPKPPLDEAPYADAKASALAASRAGKPSTAVVPAREATGAADERAPRREERSPARYFFRAAFELTWRHFADTEARGAPRVYVAFPVPGVSVAAEVYPLFGLLGVSGSLGRSFGAESTTSEQTTVGTTYLRADGALKGRMLFRRTEPSPFIAAFAGYLYSSFTFDSAPPRREVPSGTYQALRFGLDTRIPLRRFLLVGGAEYDHVVSIGPLGTVQAHAPGNGVTADFGVGFQLTPWLLGRADGRFTWLTYGLVRDVPAHAEDEYCTFGLGLEAVF